MLRAAHFLDLVAFTHHYHPPTLKAAAVAGKSTRNNGRQPNKCGRFACLPFLCLNFHLLYPPPITQGRHLRSHLHNIDAILIIYMATETVSSAAFLHPLPHLAKKQCLFQIPHHLHLPPMILPAQRPNMQQIRVRPP